jgi:predicted transcriptional regulator
MSDTIIDRSDLLALTAEIVSAHVGNNSTEDVPALIQTVFDTLSGLGTDAAPPVELTPAVPIRRSVTDDYLICLEDGKKLKMLKRHLMTSYDMTPAQYRAKWGLKADYPMVAPSYSARRGELARQIGLGRKPKVVEVVAEPAPAPKPARKARTKKIAAGS